MRGRFLRLGIDLLVMLGLIGLLLWLAFPSGNVEAPEDQLPPQEEAPQDQTSTEQEPPKDQSSPPKQEAAQKDLQPPPVPPLSPAASPPSPAPTYPPAPLPTHEVLPN